MQDTGVIIIQKDLPPTELQLYSSILCNAPLVTVDVEGTNLGRNGTASIVQIGLSETNCFIIDIYQLHHTDPLVALVRSVLENERIIKVIHDSRMDSDCLWHQYNIKLVNVHDTSCWHNIIVNNKEGNCSLNDTLSYYHIRNNSHRDSGIYQEQPTFWLQRPFNAHMIDWAAADVCRLFILYRVQVSTASSNERKLGAQQSALFTTYAKSMLVTTVRVKPMTNIGKMIGHRGVNLQRLRTHLHFLLYSYGDRTMGLFTLYHLDAATLHKIIALLPITIVNGNLNYHNECRLNNQPCKSLSRDTLIQTVESPQTYPCEINMADF
jgi:hypothetical protein